MHSPRHAKVGTPRGLVVGHHWKGAIKSNGAKPTIYPHCSAGGPIPGFQSKSGTLGKWTHPHRGHHS